MQFGYNKVRPNSATACNHEIKPVVIGVDHLIKSSLPAVTWKQGM
jgi:hypothetical protein